MLPAHHPYTGFNYLLRLNGQVVAGFRRVDLGHTELPRRRSSGQAILQDGVTYERLLLRWATNWRMGARWLRYALFWLRPKRDLALDFTHEGLLTTHTYPLLKCRVLALHLGDMGTDGAFPIRNMILGYATPSEDRKMAYSANFERNLYPSLPVGHTQDAGGATVIYGDGSG